MSWVGSFVRSAVTHTTARVLGGKSPPPVAAVAAATGAAAASTSAAASSASAPATASTASSTTTVPLSADEELQKLRAENARLKHTFHVIKLKLDKSGIDLSTLTHQPPALRDLFPLFYR
jgi:hypothetical protein